MLYSSPSEKQLEPVSRERLKQIVTRLMLHFPDPSKENQHRTFVQYMEALSHYPEDLLCAAYHHLLKHHAARISHLESLIAFMEPEYRHRMITRRASEWLPQSSTMETCL